MGILYFPLGTSRQFLALTESTKIFKEGASLSSVTYCFNLHTYLDFKENKHFYQLPENWCQCCPISPHICCKRTHQQNFLHFQLTNLSFFSSLENFPFSRQFPQKFLWTSVKGTKLPSAPTLAGSAISLSPPIQLQFWENFTDFSSNTLQWQFTFIFFTGDLS